MLLGACMEALGKFSLLAFFHSIYSIRLTAIGVPHGEFYLFTPDLMLFHFWFDLSALAFNGLASTARSDSF